MPVCSQRAAAAPESYFHEVLYTTLIDLRAQSQLLGLDSPDLEKHLRTNGGMPPSGVLDGPIGPLTPGQVDPPPVVILHAHQQGPLLESQAPGFGKARNAMEYDRY